MPLRKALIEAPLSSGLNQESDSRTLTVDGAVTMQNCVRTKMGGIRKRLGSKQLTNILQGKGFTLTAAQAVRGVNYGRAPLLFDGYKFSSYSDSRAGWTLIDAAPEAVADVRIPVAAVSGIGGDIDYAATSLGYYVVTFPSLVISGRTNIQGVIVDATSGEVVLSATIDNGGHTGLLSKVVVCGNIAIVAFVAQPVLTAGIYLSKIDLTNISAGWSVPVLFDTVTGAFLDLFDMAPVGNDSTRFALGYFKGSNVVGATVAASTFIANATYSHAPLTAGTPTSVAVMVTNTESGWVAYSINTGSVHQFEAWPFDDTAHTSGTPFLLNADGSLVGFAQIGIIRVAPSGAIIFWTEYQRTSPPFLNAVMGQQVTASGGGGTGGTPLRKTFGVMLCSKPCIVNTAEGPRCYALVNTNSSLQGTQALVCFDFFASGGSTFGSGIASDVPARLIATVAPRLSKTLGVSEGDTGPGGQISPPKLVLLGTSTLATIIYVSQTRSSAGLFIQTFDFNSQTRYFGGTIAGSNLSGLSAGVPFTFDEQTPAEMGFLWYPECIFTLINAGALTGTFSYLIVYEWTDAIGNIHRGATSPPINVAPIAQNVAIQIPTMGVTWRTRNAPTVVGANHSLFQNFAQPVRIVLYKTVNNGSIYYKFNTLTNDTSIGVITYVDDGSINVDITAPLIYTTGGVLDNFCPSSSKICITHKNRWFLAGCDDPTTVWPSKALTSGEAPGFNEAMNFNATGDVTAMASMDEKLILFVRRGNAAYGIEYVVGDGPLDTGAANDFTNPPQPVPSSVGAIDQRSIAVTEIGCVFMSPIGAPNGGGGIYLLSRDLQVHYLSGPVEDLITANPICTGVAVHPSNSLIYFEMAPTDALISSTDGVRLVYDYVNQCWSSDTHFSFVGANDGAAARTTWVAGGLGVMLDASRVNIPLVHWADYSGCVYRESSGVLATNAYADVNVNNVPRWVTASFTSAWFKPALSGFARFWRVQLQSDRLDLAQLSMSFQFDYAPASYYTETSTFTDVQMLAFDRYPQIDVEHLVGNQKAKAIQVTLVDSPPIGGYITGQGFQWSSITMEVGVEDGGRYANLPPGQRT